MSDTHAPAGPPVEEADTQAPVRRYWRLFLTVVALFVVQAAFQGGPVARVLEVVLAGTALVLAAQLEAGRERVLRIAVLVAVGSLVLAVLRVALGRDGDAGGGLLLVNGLVVAVGPVLILRSIARHPTVSVRTMIGALTTYVLIGLFFAMVYRAILLIDPGAFASATGDLDPAAMQYFSFVALTTVGFGDITPVASLTRTLVVLEALIGQIYLVTVVALVVGNLGRSRRQG
jgi:hypothetical protein